MSLRVAGSMMRRSGNRRARAVAIAIALVGAALVASRSGDLWRTLYPYLPTSVEGFPYRIRAVLPAPPRTPVPLPAPSLGATPVPSLPPTRGLRTTPVSSAAPHADPTPTTPSAAAVRGCPHMYQTWNNCGPATVAMLLGCFGQAVDQRETARGLKPDPDDKNVGPEELARFTRERGLEATVRVNGSPARLKALVALGVPVIVETWFVPHPGDEMGHYRLVTAYDDAREVFLTQDTYNGPDAAVSYADLDSLWRVFNRTYIVACPPGLADAVAVLLGPDRSDEAMYHAAIARAEAELAAGQDAYGWFNLASSLLGAGDAAGAAGAYDRARSLGLPWRMLWYQTGPFEAYAGVGRWADVRALAEANLRNAPNLEESHYWFGRAQQAAGDVAAARRSWARALELNHLFAAAAAARADAPPPALGAR
jgi:tetratricopeptide (TPR) repeat protein